MSTTRNKGMALAVGIFIVLSVIVFGSILYVGFTSINTEIVVIDTMEDEGTSHGYYFAIEEVDYKDFRLRTEEDTTESVWRGDIEYVPDRSPREPPVIRDPVPGEPVEPIRPGEPIEDADFYPRGPPIIRGPRLGQLEPV